MNQALKQRLVGAVVLVALAVIFLPALFNGGRPKQLDVQKDVTPMPKVAPLVVEEPIPPQNATKDTAVAASDIYSLEPKPQSAVETIKSAAQSVTAPSSKPSLNSKGAPNAWVLQVGVFSDATKADALKKSLQAKGYRAFTRSVTRDKKGVTRVMIGPELQQSAMSKIKTTVDRDFKVKSIVVKFEP